MVPKASAFTPKTPMQPLNNDRTPISPGYFGLAVDHGNGHHPVTSPKSPKPTQPLSSSSKRSPRVSSPRIIPLTANPDYDAFKKQTDTGRVDLSGSTLFSDSTSGKNSKLQGANTGARKRRSQDSNLADAPAASAPTLEKAETVPDGVATSQRSPKRLLSNDSVTVLHTSRRQSPADFNEADAAKSLGSPPQRQPDKSLRLSLPGHSNRAVPDLRHNRAETLPSTIESHTPIMIPAQHLHDAIVNDDDTALILDMRVATHYAQSRIKGALNLCIPTTLLKRSTYNASKLSDTFQDKEQKARFQKWSSYASIIVYDNASTQLKEANSCVNVLKKFAHEGWTGQSLILRGGFVEFSRNFPAEVEDQGPAPGIERGVPTLSLRPDAPDIPPVVGGCPMPGTNQPANPFFGNIRQNMDLIGGVGQMPIQCPSSMGKQDKLDLPEWLRRVADENDRGKTVADRFLQIEKREKKRMETALSTDVYKAAKDDRPGVIKIAGIEKGSKNRYHNIMPYEHSRVKLKGVQHGGCDYVNANFLETSLSSKRYIATQGPIPATFGDFWNMVWQQEVRVMVMLTAEMEGNQVKANNYWSTGKYGGVKVDVHSERTASLEPSRVRNLQERPDMGRRRSSHLDSASIDGAAKATDKPAPPETPSIVIRRLTITHDNHPFERMREVTQLHWASWPDFGVPTHPSHLLAVVDQCRSAVESSRGSSPGPQPERPVLVHCSAGCGRTGTFCTVDTVIENLKRQKQHRSRARQSSPMRIDLENSKSQLRRKGDDATPNHFFGQPVAPKASAEDVARDGMFPEELDLVEKVVEELRLQRLSTVQSLRQFVLCYETVLEWIADQGQPKTA